MTTSLTTFERELRTRLLDVLYGQWHDLGVPFAISPPPGSAEVIDPEALIWCSLEFLPAEPRLREAITAWLHTYQDQVITQRINKWAKGDEPRATAWRALTRPTKKKHTLDFRLGNAAPGPSTTLIRARNVLGSDIRHFLLLYLLANPRGGLLTEVQRWSGYSYRSISKTAVRWESAGVVTIERGYCRLIESEPWRTLLNDEDRPFVLVNWPVVFDACVVLLRTLSKAQRKGLPLESPVVTAHKRDALAVLSSPYLGHSQDAPSISHVRELLAADARARHIA